MSTIFDEVESSKTITMSAFTLSPHGKMARSLEAAALRGATVSVVLDGKAFGNAEIMNGQLKSDFAHADVHVHFSTGPLHLKAAVFDHERIYLSDRNFTSGGKNEVVLADPYVADRALVERAMLGVPGSNDHLWLRKADALAAETQLIVTAPGPNVDVQTESFSVGTGVYEAMIQKAHQGDRVRLLVYESQLRNNEAERRALKALAQQGVIVRVAETNEKLAIAGDRSFVASANLTRGLPDQIDFGFYIGDPVATRIIQSQFNDNWDNASIL
jgi:phosphatidylserine/phosphatidylglycerophosphate/cardiolipin synthase-like enzyme